MLTQDVSRGVISHCAITHVSLTPTRSGGPTARRIDNRLDQKESLKSWTFEKLAFSNAFKKRAIFLLVYSSLCGRTSLVCGRMWAHLKPGATEFLPWIMRFMTKPCLIKQIVPKSPRLSANTRKSRLFNSSPPATINSYRFGGLNINPRCESIIYQRPRWRISRVKLNWQNQKKWFYFLDPENAWGVIDKLFGEKSARLCVLRGSRSAAWVGLGSGGISLR